MTQLASDEPEQLRTRVRRPADLLLALVAVVALAVLFGIAHGLPIGTRELTDNVATWSSHHVPRALAVVVAAAADLGCVAIVVTAIVTMVRSDRHDLLNALVAFVLGVGFATGCDIAWESRVGGIATAMLRGTLATALIFTVAFTAFVIGTDLVRRPRWTRWCLLAVGALLLGELLLADLTFYAALVAPLMGWATGLAVRWALTTASVRPTPDALQAWLERSGVPVAGLAERSWRTGFGGVLADGERFTIELANRDTRGSGIARRIWRSLRLRGAATGSEVLGSRSQLEHHALASYATAAAGVAAPRVLILAEAPPETLVLALSCTNGSPLGPNTSSEQIVELFAALRALHRAGVAHRDLRPANVFAGANGAGFISLERAQTGSGELLRRLDVAQLLTTLASIVGAPDAVMALRDGYHPDDEQAIAAILQPVALAAWGWSAMRAARACLTEVRLELVGPEARAPALRLERFRWRTVLSTVAITLAAFLLVGQLSKVNLLGALGEMNPGWFLLAILGSTLTYLGAAINLAAFVPKRLSLVRGFWVQLSSAFVGIAMPPTVGHVAVNSRYLHRQGVDESAIAAAVAVSQIVNVATTVPLLLVIGLITGSEGAHIKIVPEADLVIGAVAILAAVGLLLALPHTRALLSVYVWPHVRTVIPRLLEAVSQPLRLVVGIAGNMLLTVGYVAALLFSLRALGAHTPVLATGAVYLAGNAVGSVAPTPGGLGAVEAVLSAGLTAIGIPAHQAVPAVLLFRTATLWLPIPAGWLSFFLLQKSGTL